MRSWICSTNTPGRRITPFWCLPTSSAIWKSFGDYIAFLHKGRLLFCEEKDRLKEHFGLLRGPRSLLDSSSSRRRKGIRQSDYAVEALVERCRVPASLHLDTPTVEEIILLLAKGEH